MGQALEETVTVEPVCSSSGSHITYRQYVNENDLPIVMELVDNELSEPYSIFTYRYFLRNWPQLCFFALHNGKPFGTVVCKMDHHRGKPHLRGYLAMLVVDKKYRGKGIGSELVHLSIQEMIRGGCEEVTLEAEVSNYGALNLYRNLGFIRDKRLSRYYLNGVDAYRLKLLLPASDEVLARQGLEDLKLAPLCNASEPVQPALELVDGKGLEQMQGANTVDSLGVHAV